MKLIATLAVFLLVPLIKVRAEEEKIPQITTLRGDIYKNVRVTKIDGKIVTIMHDDGIKKLDYSEMDEANGRLLGLETYQKKLADIEAAKKAKEDAEKQKSAAENQKNQWLKERRKIAINDLNSNKKKTVIDWYDLYILQDDLKNSQDLKSLFGRSADLQSGNTLVWTDICWNPNTEKMDSIRVDKTSYTRLDGSQTITEFIFRCGDKKYEVMDAPMRIAFKEVMWSKEKAGE